MEILLTTIMLLFMVSALLVIIMTRINSSDTLIASNILFGNKYSPKNDNIRTIANVLRGLYIFFNSFFIINLIKAIRNDLIDTKTFALRLIMAIICVTVILFYLGNSFVEDVSAIRTYNLLKKQKSQIEEVTTKVIEKFKKAPEKLITTKQQITFYGLNLGNIIIYEQPTANKEEFVFGSIIVTNTEISDSFWHLSCYGCSSSKLSDVIKSNVINGLEKEDKKKYIYLIDNLLDKDNIVSIHKDNVSIYENIIGFNIKNNELLEDDSVDVDNAKSQNILKGLESNEDEDIKRVYEVVDNFLRNPDYELGKEDVEEIIDIYISDESIKDEFTYVINNNDCVYESPIDALRIFKKEELL